jgi:hypothetical protein
MTDENAKHKRNMAPVRTDCVTKELDNKESVIIEVQKEVALHDGSDEGGDPSASS